MQRELGRLLVVDDDLALAEQLRLDGQRLGLSVLTLHEPDSFEDILVSWQPTIIALDLVMPDADGLELLHQCCQLRYPGNLILMSGGFELYLRMADEIARTNGLRVVGKLPKPFRAKQFSYLLMTLL